MKLDNIKFTKKLALLLGVYIFGFLAFVVVAYQTIDRVKVGGSLYEEILLGKDLISEVLPPAECIIESYLVTLQLVDETDQKEIASLIERLQALEKDYRSRHEYWVDTLPPGEIRTAVVDASYQPAVE